MKKLPHSVQKLVGNIVMYHVFRKSMSRKIEIFIFPPLYSKSYEAKYPCRKMTLKKLILNNIQPYYL